MNKLVGAIILPAIAGVIHGHAMFTHNGGLCILAGALFYIAGVAVVKLPGKI